MTDWKAAERRSAAMARTAAAMAAGTSPDRAPLRNRRARARPGTPARAGARSRSAPEPLPESLPPTLDPLGEPAVLVAELWLRAGQEGLSHHERAAFPCQL